MVKNNEKIDRFIKDMRLENRDIPKQDVKATLSDFMLFLKNEPATLQFDFNEEIEFILGRPNFFLGPYAHRLRDLGHDIPKKAEAEQAYVMYLLLELYFKHGIQYRDEFMKMMRLDEIEK